MPLNPPPGAGTGDMLALNNLSEIASQSASQTNLGLDSMVGRVAPTTIAAAGNTDVALAALQRFRLAALTVSAGSAPYVHTVTVQTANAQAGARMTLDLALPASRNPRIEIRNATSGGTLLGVAPVTGFTGPWVIELEYSGSAWQRVFTSVPSRLEGVAEHPAETANLAAFIQSMEAEAVFYPLPRQTLRTVLFAGTDRIDAETILNGNKTWTAATSKYIYLTRGYGDFNVTMPPIGGSDDPVGTIRYVVMYGANTFDSVTFKQPDGTTTITSSNAAGRRWFIFTAGASTWSVVATNESAVSGGSALFQHLGTTIASYGDGSFRVKLARTESWRIRFKFTGARFWLRYEAAGGNYLMLVDGERYASFSPLNTGTTTYQRVQFSTSGTREIEICSAGNFRFGGVALDEAGAAVAATDFAAPATMLGSIGDSTTEQRGVAGDAPGEYAARVLGMQAFISSDGSGGYTVNGTSSGTTLINRVQADLLNAMNAHTGSKIFEVHAGINDLATADATFRAAVDAFMDYVDANLTGTVLAKVAYGPHWPRDGEDIAAKAQIIKEEAAAHGWLFIPKDKRYFGRQDSPANPGNATLYISDGTHMTSAGRRYDGVRSAYELQRARGLVMPVIQ